MSRICVKNISKNANEQQLRDMFSSKGEVTDVKLLTKDGKTRKIAFVGFRTEIQANEAQKYFNNTFMGLSRIVVEIAKKVNDKSLIEAKLKHQKKGKPTKEDVSDHENVNVSEKEQKSSDKQKKEPLTSKNKAEFMEVMKNRRNAKFWTNDDVVGNDNEATVASSNLDYTKGAKFQRGSDASDSDGDSDEEANEINDFSGKTTHAADKTKSSKENSTSLAATVASSGQGTMSDLEYMKSKMAHFSDSDDSDNDEDREPKKSSGINSNSKPQQEYSSGEEEDGDDDGSDKMELSENEEDVVTNHGRSNRKTDNRPPKKVSTKLPDVVEDKETDADLEDSARLFVKNIPFSCTEEEFSTLFSKYGVISEVHLPIDKERRGKGFGFIQFMIPENATTALEDLNGSSFQGRNLHITKAFRKIDYSGVVALNEDGTEKEVKPSKLSSFQQKKEEERRKFANKQEGWNAAYVRSDTVVESLADKYGISRSDILDTTEGGGELAVRLAIGETQVIQENRDYFAAHGVDLSALESAHSSSKASKRSNTTLLVKNLPFDLVEDEVESMFARFGAIAAFLVPKSKAIALVDFVEPTEARAAYKGLAYRSYKHMPLYLEWAPVGTIDKDKAAAAAAALQKKKQLQNGDKNKEDKKASKKESKDDAADGEKPEEDNLDEYSTLFIKNLNFITTETNLRDHFAHLHIDGCRTVSIQKKQLQNGTILSQGYAFAEFSSYRAAQEALVKLNGSVIDNHALLVKPSDKRLTIQPVVMKTSNKSTASSSSSGDAAMANNPGNNNKIIVRNVAFQATKHEIRSLFATFGSIKRVRIPKKMGGEHRGFAFVDFSTAQEAATAMASLKDTHLYGRHLVLEWAKEEDEDEHVLGKTPGGAAGQGANKLEALRKRARADETVIREEGKRQRAKGKVDDDAIGGGIGSDDI